MIVENGRATGASPDNRGGGIYVYNSSPTFIHSMIRSNFAKTSGGGLYLEESNAVLADNIIVDNSAGNGGPSAYGGGLYLVGCSFPFHGGVIDSDSKSFCIVPIGGI